MLMSIADTEKVAKYIKSDQKNSIRLMFPSLDFGYSYEPNAQSALYDYFDLGTNEIIMDKRTIDKGQLIQHIKIFRNNESTLEVNAIRKLLTKKCY